MGYILLFVVLWDKPMLYLIILAVCAMKGL